MALSPRTYFLLDRLSKLAALVLVAASLEGAAGSLSPYLGLVGIILGITTIFIDIEE